MDSLPTIQELKEMTPERIAEIEQSLNEELFDGTNPGLPVDAKPAVTPAKDGNV